MSIIMCMALTPFGIIPVQTVVGITPVENYTGNIDVAITATEPISVVFVTIAIVVGIAEDIGENTGDIGITPAGILTSGLQTLFDIEAVR